MRERHNFFTDRVLRRAGQVRFWHHLELVVVLDQQLESRWYHGQQCVGTVRHVVLRQRVADDHVFRALRSKRGPVPQSPARRRLVSLSETEALHGQGVTYCSVIGCAIALQECQLQCQIPPLSRSGAQDVPRSQAEYPVLLHCYFTSTSGKCSETLQPKQLMDLGVLGSFCASSESLFY